ncbi:MAG: hypothetical protein GY928_05265 [Colwellia sp.]|nr:hypothetical protein [Colwellia sp.]
MKKYSIFITSLVFSSQVFSAAQINYLNIDGDAVHFSISEDKPDAPPACVVEESNDRYAVSLDSEAGRAIYSLLITAMASKQPVTVEGSQDCNNVDGIERAQGVSISPVFEEQESNKVQWMGYTQLVAGNFLRNKQTSPFIEGSKKCSAVYPGSRLMVWNDVVDLKNNYPFEHDIWFFDAVESLSTAQSRDRYDNTIRSSVIYKDGQVREFFRGESYGEFDGKDITRYLTCRNWTESHYRSSGTVFTKSGKFFVKACNTSARLSCVK